MESMDTCFREKKTNSVCNCADVILCLIISRDGRRIGPTFPKHGPVLKGPRDKFQKDRSLTRPQQTSPKIGTGPADPAISDYFITSFYSMLRMYFQFYHQRPSIGLLGIALRAFQGPRARRHLLHPPAETAPHILALVS